MAGILLLLAVIGVVWHLLLSLLVDVPGLAVGLLGWLFAIAGLLLAPYDKLRSGRTRVLVALLCLHTAVLAYFYEFLIGIVQLSSPATDVLVVFVLVRIFWLLQLQGVPRWLAWLVSASFWPVWILAAVYWFGGYTEGWLITKRIANRTAQLASAVSPSFLPTYSELLDTHPLAAWLGPSVILLVFLPAFLLFVARRRQTRA